MRPRETAPPSDIRPRNGAPTTLGAQQECSRSSAGHAPARAPMRSRLADGLRLAIRHKRPLRVGAESVRSWLGALAEGREAASTKAVTIPSTGSLPLEALSNSAAAPASWLDFAGRRESERTIASVAAPACGRLLLWRRSASPRPAGVSRRPDAQQAAAGVKAEDSIVGGICDAPDDDQHLRRQLLHREAGATSAADHAPEFEDRRHARQAIVPLLLCRNAEVLGVQAVAVPAWSPRPNRQGSADA